MKKFLGLFLCFVLSFVLVVGCDKENPVESITISAEKTEVFVGDEFKLGLEIKPIDALNTLVEWSSSDSSIASVNQDGTVSALKAGNVTIIAQLKSDSSIKGEITFIVKEKVEDNKVSKIEVSLSSLSIFVGEEATIAITVSPEEATNKEYEVVVSDSSIIAVEDGKVKGLKEGTATITVNAKDGSNVSSSVTIEVKRVLEPQITLALPEKVYLGEEFELTYDGKDLTEDVVFTSSNDSVISIQGTKATAVGLGQALITAKANGVEVSSVVKVEQTPEISLNVPGVLYPGSEVEILYTLTNLTGEVVFTSSNEEVFTVSGNLLTAVNAGTATLTAKVGDVVNTIEVTVLTAPVIIIVGPTQLEYGKTSQLQLTIEGIEGTGVWSSSNEEVATVDQNGLLTGIALGTVSIYYEIGDFFGEYEVEIVTPVFTVRFFGFNDTLISEEQVPNRKGAKEPDVPTVEGYKFISWDKKFDDIKGDLDVYAIYKKICNITYELDGGTIPSDAPMSFIASFAVTLPIAKKDGYKFTGWSLTVGGEKLLTIGENEEDDVVLYANYKVQEEEVYTVGPNESYTSLTSVLAVADEGAKITVLPGTYSDSPTIALNNITIIGPNANNSAADGSSRNEEALFTGLLTISKNISGVSISGLQFNAKQSIVASSASNVTINNCIFKGASEGYSGLVQFTNVTNLEMTGNHITVDTKTSYAYGIYVSNLATDIKIESNYFTNTATTANNLFAIRIQQLAGEILIRKNLFYDFAGDYWTVYLGNGGTCAPSTYVEFIENVIDGSGDSNKYACGIAVENFSDDTAYLLIIGNTFRYCKDTVLGLRGTSNTDSISKPTIKIMYNSFESVSARMRLGFAKDNFVFAYNYKFQAYTNQGTTSIDASKFTEGDFDSIDTMKQAYEEFKKKPLVTFANITYELDGGEVNGANRYEVGKGLNLPIPTKEFGTFLGWTLTKDSTDYITEITKDMTGDVTLYAHWIVEKNFTITYDHDGGVSNELYSQCGTPAQTLTVDNYNYNNGTFWSGKYATDVFLGEASCDPTATFSDRIYIGKDPVTGLYKIINILNSGASSWPSGAEYVLTISSSYSGYGSLHPIVLKLSVGMTLAFSKPVTQFTKDQPGKVYFYKEAPKDSVISVKCTSNDELISPSKLGFVFLGWYDESGKKYESMLDVEGNVTLKAKWLELDPVTDIIIEQMPTELIDGETFQINAKVYPSNAYFQDVYYKTSNKDIISVTESGLLTAVNAGTCKITVYDYMQKVIKEFDIVVNNVKSIDVQFDDDYYGTIHTNESVNLYVKAYGKNVANTVFTFTSSNENIATINENGVITAKATGTVTITISAPGFESLDVSVVVSELSDQEKLDKVIKLITENNFATVDFGNLCLYNDGTQRNYVATYGSVNNFLFDDLVIDTTYNNQAVNNPNCHKDRRAGIDTIEFVCVHDTATLTGTVESIGNGMSSGETSIHYTVGNGKVLSVVPEKYIAYHAGDGTGTAFKWNASGVKYSGNDKPEFDIVKDGSKWYWVINGVKSTLEAPITDGSKTIANPGKNNITYTGPTWKVVNGEYYLGTTWVCFTQYAAGSIASKGGNNNSIGIEMCSNLSGDMYDTYQRTAKLVADILIRNGLDLTRVKQHNTFSGKNCPQTLRSGNYWEQFMKMVEINYILQKDFSDVKVSMVSNNPEYVSNNGRIIKAPTTTKSVSYTFTVKCGSESKSTTLYSVIPGSTLWTQWNGTYSSSLVWNNGNFAKREK